MTLNIPDLHFVYSHVDNRLACWNSAHELIWKAECHNSTVADGQYGHFGNCPPGEFLLGSPEPVHEAPFGWFKTPVLDYGDHHVMVHWGRGGILVHGGGSGLADSFAPEQGWMETHGCLRLQNSNNDEFVGLVLSAQAGGGRCYLTVAGEE